MWLLCGEQTVGRQGMSEDHSGNADVWGEGRWRGWLREGGVSLKAEPVPFAGGADGCEGEEKAESSITPPTNLAWATGSNGRSLLREKQDKSRFGGKLEVLF